MKLNEKELNAISGGQIIKSEDGKFFVLPDDTPSFNTKEDAEAAQKLMFKFKPHEGKPPFMHPHMHHHHPHTWKKPMFDIKNMPEELQKKFPPNNESPEKQ